MKKTHWREPTFLAALLSAAAFAQDKIGVLPFSVVSGEVPPHAGAKAAVLFATEIKNAEGLQWVESKAAPAAEPSKDGLVKAQALSAQAAGQRAHRQFRAAEESLRASINAAQGAASALTDIAELQDAWVLLSAVQYNTGRDDDGQKSLGQALALAPNRELPLAKTSPLFARVVHSARGALQTGLKGNLVVESTPPGATVAMDGVILGNAPLLIRNVPPGAHLWRVQLPSGEVGGGVADVQAGKTARASAQMQTQDPASRVNAELAQNKLSPAAVTAAQEAGAAMDAQELVLGGLVRDGKDLELHAFLLDVAHGGVRRLAPARFDPEFLSAGMAMYGLVGDIDKKGNQAGEAAQVPCAVVPKLSAQGARVAEVDYAVKTSAPVVESEGATETPTGSDEPRTPAGQKSRKPLSK